MLASLDSRLIVPVSSKDFCWDFIVLGCSRKDPAPEEKETPVPVPEPPVPEPEPPVLMQEEEETRE